MKLNRKQLRKLILREMKILSEDSSLYAHLDAARDELIQRNVLDKNCAKEPTRSVILGIGKSKEAALQDAQRNYDHEGNNPRMGGYLDSDPEVNHQIDTPAGPLHVVVQGNFLKSKLDDTGSDVEDF